MTGFCKKKITIHSLVCAVGRSSSFSFVVVLI
jgi:hypothetical protein